VGRRSLGGWEPLFHTKPRLFYHINPGMGGREALCASLPGYGRQEGLFAQSSLLRFGRKEASMRLVPLITAHSTVHTRTGIHTRVYREA